MGKGTTVDLAAVISENTRVLSPAGAPHMLFSMPSNLNRISYLIGQTDTILVGRRTFKLLVNGDPKWTANRHVLVLCTMGKPHIRDNGGIPVGRLDEALELSGLKLLVIGGYETFISTLPYVDHVHLTIAHMEMEARGQLLPALDPRHWSILPQNMLMRQRYNPDDICHTSYEYGTRIGAPVRP